MIIVSTFFAFDLAISCDRTKVEFANHSEYVEGIAREITVSVRFPDMKIIKVLIKLVSSSMN